MEIEILNNSAPALIKRSHKNKGLFQIERARHDRPCTKCSIKKPFEDFYSRTHPDSKRTYRYSMCKACYKVRLKEKLGINPKYVHLVNRRHSIKKYGITQKRYFEILEIQDGGCGICGTTKPGSNPSVHGERMHIDHDHSTGAVRGLLCAKCNAALGQMRDNPELLRKAAAYLEMNKDWRNDN